MTELILPNKVKYHETGLSFHDNITFKEWQECGEILKRIERASQWWIGDWLNAGEQKWGEMYAQAIDETDAAYDTLRKYKWVSAAIPLCRRRHNLSFNIHSEIASLPKKDQEAALQQAEEDKWTVSKAREQVALIKNPHPTDNPSLPTKKYDVVIIDPPWPMKKIARKVRPNQIIMDYPVQTEEEILSIELPCKNNCHVWLWTTHKFLPLALECLKSWQLKYICTFVWHKPGGFQAVGLPQYNSEFILYARFGTPSFVDTKAFNTTFNAPRGKHSEKPDEFYKMVRRVTDGKRIDMFSRRAISGFEAWGNEVV